MRARTRTVTSRLPGFHALPLEERRRRIARMYGLSPGDLRSLRGEEGLVPESADAMIENAIGTFELPLGLGLNLVVNGRDYVVPMAVEEPSVVAALSLAGKIVRGAGGFTAEADPPTMIAQVQVARYGDPEVAAGRILAAKPRLLALANRFHPTMVRRGGGARDIEVRILPAPEGAGSEPLLIVHLLIDTREAMGANLVNTAAEGIAPLLEELTGGKVYLRILSNLADRRLARASCRIPLRALADFGMAGDEIAEGIVQASRFATADPYRAATHNKGIMNGIDAAAIATGQDWRAIEAGAHAFACRGGRYQPLSTWSVADGALCGRIELPLALGTVGGSIRLHPVVRIALKLLRVTGARELAMVFAAVGLAQNFAALRALGSVGIQQGHMALHARCVATAAGAPRRKVRRVR
ncbi:MAG TPA: hydroxymethylglutaryl-CoA reductase, degradative [Candidatus Binatia bacterium]|nr:hydroxymethylglutaryl-CoA reductase, degradative [Candidatus Binatia bacterium]